MIYALLNCEDGQTHYSVTNPDFPEVQGRNLAKAIRHFKPKDGIQRIGSNNGIIPGLVEVQLCEVAPFGAVEADDRKAAEISALGLIPMGAFCSLRDSQSWHDETSPGVSA